MSEGMSGAMSGAMSGQGLRKAFTAGATAAALLAAALAVPSPAIAEDRTAEDRAAEDWAAEDWAAEDCAALSAHFMLCAQGSPWAGATWHPFGDGAALELGPYTLDFTEHWMTREDGVALDAALEVLLHERHLVRQDEDSEDGDSADGESADGESARAAPLLLLLRDRFDTGHLRVERALQRIDMADGSHEITAVMLAQGRAARIGLFLGAEAGTAPADLAREARALAEMIRPWQED